MAPPDLVANFITRWSKAEAAERANYALFLTQLCGILDVPAPDPAGPDAAKNAYVFERGVTFQHRGGKTSTGRIDLYKRDAFVCECKQYASQHAETDDLAIAIDDPSAAAKKGKIARGSEAWDRAMIEAHGQADRYARSLPTNEDPPPFLLVVDVGHVIELYADFTQKGKAYLPFPDARAHRIRLADLAREDVRAKLRTIWLDPLSLDPAKVSAAVTREVAVHLAELAKSFEKKHDPAIVAAFLSRCLFCMFAEDIELLPKNSFSQLLESVKSDPGASVPLLQQLFAEMNVGKFSNILRKKILHFNGGLFSDATALPLDGTQLGLLSRTAKLEWRHVEPAIFGTLLERALNSAERHKLGAHYTPRAYVERLVLPTVVEPLREEWSGVKTAAVTLATRGDLKGAIKEARAFHHRLCSLRVLDPACGSGNFLYVTLEHLKRLEGEVFQLIEGFGENMRLDLGGETVDPHQFLGLEINPRAATIAELVLWIGYLQWHHRNRGATEWPEPVLRAFKNIECRDAVLAYDKEEFARDDNGKVRYVWDRKTTKVDAVTGRDVPDDKAVIPLHTYVKPEPAKWPKADYIVGNPPFIGNKRMRDDLGSGYVDALRSAYPEVPDSVDFVMYWWEKSAALTRGGGTRRFGLITRNSITQIFNRRVVQNHLDSTPPLTIRFAIPNHPWVDTADGAQVRIAMTVGESNDATDGRLNKVEQENPQEDGEIHVKLSEEIGVIQADLSIGVDLLSMSPLKSNQGLACPGVQLSGKGFVIGPHDLAKFSEGSRNDIVRRYLTGYDLMQKRREQFVLDTADRDRDVLRLHYPDVFQHLADNVKGTRSAKAATTQDSQDYARQWWRMAKPRTEFRKTFIALDRFIVSSRTSRHRVFEVCPAGYLPETKVLIVALREYWQLGVLSSTVHVTFAIRRGGWHGVGNDPTYNHTECFDPFPFPDCTLAQKSKIGALAEELEAHRKRVQDKHGLGLTHIYNVLEKVRTGAELTAKDKVIHDAALVSTLKQLHDDLDQAVADAYGWAWPLTDAHILEKIVALNTSRSAEEAKGNVRWLRPDYQKPLVAGENQSSLGFDDGEQRVSKPTVKETKKPTKAKKTVWPKSMADRAKAVEAALVAAEHPITAAILAKQFARAKGKDVAEILETLAALGRAHTGDTPGTYVR